MKVLVACEFSGTVRDAFIRRGFDAISCDLQPSESPGPHVQGDVGPLLTDPWDLVIAHPPCDRLCQLFWTNIGHADGRGKRLIHEVPPAINFFKRCLHANAPHVAVENPHMHVMAKQSIGQATTVIEPWHFGEPYTKRTLLWLRGLPPLMPTNIVTPEMPWVSGGVSTRPAMTRNNSSKRTKRARARTFPAIAEAMADQWGAYLLANA